MSRFFRNKHSGDIHPEYAGRSSQSNFPNEWEEVIPVSFADPFAEEAVAEEPVVEVAIAPKPAKKLTLKGK